MKEGTKADGHLSDGREAKTETLWGHNPSAQAFGKGIRLRRVSRLRRRCLYAFSGCCFLGGGGGLYHVTVESILD